MKNHLFTFAFLALVSCSSGTQTQQFAASQIIHHQEYQKLEDPAALNKYVAFINKGEVIPLKIILDTSVVKSRPQLVDLFVQKKLFFRVTIPKNITKQDLELLRTMDNQKISQLNESKRKDLLQGIMLYISQDTRTWAPLGNLDSVRSALSLKEIAVSFGMLISKEAGLASNLTIREQGER